MGLAVRCVQEMLFKKAAAPEPCDEAPCGTGMAYLQPTYKRTVNEHAWHVPRMHACMHARQACSSSMHDACATRANFPTCAQRRPTLCTAPSTELRRGMTLVPTKCSVYTPSSTPPPNPTTSTSGEAVNSFAILVIKLCYVNVGPREMTGPFHVRRDRELGPRSGERESCLFKRETEHLCLRQPMHGVEMSNDSRRDGSDSVCSGEPYNQLQDSVDALYSLLKKVLMIRKTEGSRDRVDRNPRPCASNL